MAEGRTQISKWQCWAALFISVLFSSSDSIAAAADPPNTEAIIGGSRISDQRLGSLSNDGQWLAYVDRSCVPEASGGAFRTRAGMRSQTDGCSEIWIANTITGERIRVSDGSGRADDPIWSPNGRQLAFVASYDGEARVWLWDRYSRVARRVSATRVRLPIFEDIPAARWTRDGRSLIILAEVAPAGEDAPNQPSEASQPPRVQVFSNGSGSEENDPTAAIDSRATDLTRLSTSDLARIDISSGSVTLLARQKAIRWFDVSPDSRTVALSTIYGVDIARDIRTYTLQVIRLDGTGASSSIQNVHLRDGLAIWSPDSSRLAYINASERHSRSSIVDVAYSNGALGQAEIIVSPSTQRRFTEIFWGSRGELIAKGSDGSIFIARTENNSRRMQELNTLHATNIIGVRSSAGGASVLFSFRNSAARTTGIGSLNISSGRLTNVGRWQSSSIFGRPILSGSMIAFAIESAQMPPELRSIDLSTGNSRTLGPPREIDPETLATTERIEFQGSNGAPRKAAIYLPPGFRMGQRLRTIILLYPQDWSRADMLDTFGGGFSGFTRAQIYASRGFVVIIPDISLSPGDIADQIAGDVSSVINAAAGAGYTDPDRVGLLGYSFGGYSVLAAATRLPSLRAIVAGGAFGDLGAFYGKMQDSGFGSWAAWMENGHGRVGATPWGNPERYIRNSPFYRIDRIRAPLLLFVGMDDTSTPPWLSNQIFVAMRRAGNTVEYRQYAGEAHRFIGRASILDVANRAISWFDTHL